MIHYKPSKLKPELKAIREEGIVRGEYCGFTCLDEIYTAKKGYPLFVAGAPHAGKTEFTLEMLINLSIFKGWKHFIYLGENGTAEEIIAELAYKYVGKPYRKLKGEDEVNDFAMSDAERDYAEYFIEEHFWIMDTERLDSKYSDFTLTDFYNAVDEVEKSEGIKFDTTLLDPWNDVEQDLSKFGNREDKYLTSALKYVRRQSKINNRIDIIVNHIAQVSPVFDKDSKQNYFPPALPDQWAGGRVWWRRAFTMILIYRPPVYLIGDNGEPVYKENETHVIVQKGKPKGAAKVGRVSLFFDWKKQRYYEETLKGNEYARNNRGTSVVKQEEPLF